MRFRGPGRRAIPPPHLRTGEVKHAGCSLFIKLFFILEKGTWIPPGGDFLWKSQHLAGHSFLWAKRGEVMESGPGLWGWQCHGQTDTEEGMLPPWAAREGLAGGLEGARRSWEAGTTTRGQALEDGAPPRARSGHRLGRRLPAKESPARESVLGVLCPRPPSQHPQALSRGDDPDPPQALGVCLQRRPEPPRSAAPGPGHGTQGLGRRPHGEGWRGRGVQAGGAQAGRGQQAEPLEQAGKQQEQLGLGQTLAHAHAAACRGNRGRGGDPPGLGVEGEQCGEGRLWGGPREQGLEHLGHRQL